MTPTAATRLVTQADDPALSHVLARAFATDPLLTWVLPDAASRARSAPHFFAWELRRLTGDAWSWTTETRAGAALWAPPGRWRETPMQALRLAFTLAVPVGHRAPRVLRGMSMIERAHPRTPHAYLAILGVDTEHQGLGLGSTILTPGLNRCDEQGLPAYLETATERNLPFYERHGFKVTGELTLPKGPPIWLMWREPH